MTNQEQLNKADQLSEETQQEYMGCDHEVAY